ncbi:CDP-glucose 4,6-dehydratase [Fulvivirga lutimaris]|uniref:CDP-glucose 4,6-dehydratase n=1 Tax=Fulvivirga lutimaris TaxID=1819566 RepID=UPI0012BC9219|nr:CDP-glucose 4,6-dehydratase [Fulvivirga lutimaris]MTI38244.1 CDP-glucose 4,6-dehydratase [Fulvivirga lutimaris]
MESLDIRSAFKDKRILVTGHTGFKGSWLLTILTELGSKVRGYSLPPEKNGLFDQIEGHLLCESVYGDILDKDKLNETILDYQPHYVFHLAAQSLVLKSYSQPNYTFEVNGIGTANLLMSLSKLKNECSIVIVTTDKVYENEEQNHTFSENDPLGGHDPYSASKACAEIITSSIRGSFFKNSNQYIATARAGNVIGGGDWSENRLLPDIARALIDGDPIKLRNPNSVRPWQHVLDPLYGYLRLAVMLNTGNEHFQGAYNFGPLSNDVFTVSDMSKLAVDCWGSGGIEISESQNAKKEAKYLSLDSRKANKGLQWEPKLSVEESIKWTIDWYSNYANNNSSSLDYTKKQFSEYLRRL